MEFAEAEEVKIRWSIKRDLESILKIETESFDYPWQEEDFIRVLRQRNCIGMTAESGKQIVGYMVYELHRSRIELLNIAVDGLWRRKQVGTQMIDRLRGKLSKDRRTHIATKVRESNLQGLAFFKSHDFRVKSIEGAPFEECEDDAYVMKCEPFRKGLTVSLTNRITQHEGPLS